MRAKQGGARLAGSLGAARVPLRRVVACEQQGWGFNERSSLQAVALTQQPRIELVLVGNMARALGVHVTH